MQDSKRHDENSQSGALHFTMQQVRTRTNGPWLASAGLRLSNWFERWFPELTAAKSLGVHLGWIVLSKAQVARHNHNCDLGFEICDS